MSGIFLVTATFLATCVEMVEVLTILLATGITRGWRSPLLGAATAAVVLAFIVIVFGAALTTLIPLNALRIVIGTLLLIFGLQWLRKAILRAAGLKALHDEDRIFAEEVQALKGEAPSRGAIDWVGFTVAFKGVLLEGLEVVFIVLTFGSNASDDSIGGFSGVSLAAVGALAAAVLVSLAGLIIHRPLARVPENTMKFGVGLMLVVFGVFWAGEGIGVKWMWDDATILVLMAVFGVLGWLAVLALRRTVQAKVAV